jgi:hypothetical protein
MPTYIVTLEDFTPGQRYDALPWTQARIEQGQVTTPDGTYTTLETIDLSPVDTDPTAPQTRNFTTALATIPEGWFRVTFLDAAGSEQRSAPVYFPGSEGQVPTVFDVAALLRARTVDANNNRGNFSSTTKPTADEVRQMIDRAAEEVRRRAGPVLETTEDESLLAAARHLAAVRAAMFVELSYYPEQATEDASAYGRLKEMWDEDLASLTASLTGEPGDVQGIGSIRVASPTAAAYMDQVGGFDPWVP